MVFSLSSFYCNITNLNQTITTDNNGVASYTYNGASRGDLTFTSTVYSLSDTINVEDCITYYLAEQSATGNTTADVNFFKLPKWQNNGSFTCIMEFKSTSHKFCAGIRDTTARILRCAVGKNTSNAPSVYMDGGITQTSNTISSKSIANNTWYSLKIVIDGLSISMYLNDALFYTGTINDVSSRDVELNGYIQTWGYLSVHIRNIKIKPLVSP